MLAVGMGERHDRLRDLAWGVLSQGANEQTLEAAIAEWWSDARDVVKTKDEAVSRREFRHHVEGWRPPAAGVIDWPDAYPTANETVGLPPHVRYPTSPGTEGLLRLCVWMQRRSSKGYFFLSQRDAGEALGVTHTAAARKLKALVRDGHLVLMRQGWWGANVGVAAVYRCAVAAWAVAA